MSSQAHKAFLLGQGSNAGARTSYRRVLADLKADSLLTVPPTPRLTDDPQWKVTAISNPQIIKITPPPPILTQCIYYSE
ncbi:hypothetical protein PoB_003747700 [Plakobranchus ocellatus]|uniref:Uncharacterized protein n=1 Tax=Plakobranchus ocellatus TaxID=259542 RepID=A0AAV4AUH1_9GAST|nr:hypothetical protein PoB_003747700 [Plakobranchus ocellatus]